MNTTTIVERTFYVAKSKAEEGYATEVGTTIRKTPSIWLAKRFYSPGAIMSWMGGHYTGYEAVKVHVKSELTDFGTVPFPPESEVFDGMS